MINQMSQNENTQNQFSAAIKDIFGFIVVTTKKGIMNYGHGMRPTECGGISEYENGNGSLMRVLPLAYYFEKQKDCTIEAQMETVHNVSALTHRHPVSLIGCGIYINNDD